MKEYISGLLRVLGETEEELLLSGLSQFSEMEIDDIKSTIEFVYLAVQTKKLWS